MSDCMLEELTFKIGAKVTRFELCSKGVCLNVGASRVFQSSFYIVSLIEDSGISTHRSFLLQ